MNELINEPMEYFSKLFVLVMGSGILLMVALFVLDRLQTSDAIRHNYPLIGRFRYVFSTLGEFFRVPVDYSENKRVLIDQPSERLRLM